MASFKRSFIRNLMKRNVGKKRGSIGGIHNRIAQYWRNAQIKKYGISAWLFMYNRCVGSKLYKDSHML